MCCRLNIMGGEKEKDREERERERKTRRDNTQRGQF